MTDVVTLAFDFTLGMALGAAFYGGLWWTVCRLAGKQAGPWLLGSFALRAATVLAGFYIIARGPWHGLLACVAGLFVSRVAVTRFIRVTSKVNAGTAP